MISKESIQSFATEAAAMDVASGLQSYAAAFDEEPLRVAALKDVQVIARNDSYHVRHDYELITGPSIVRMPMSERHAAVAALLAQVAGMRTQSDKNTLITPFDAKSENFHVDGQGPALTDIYPALTRRADGSFPLDALGQGRGSYFPWSMGTQVGAMTKILSTAIDRGRSAGAKFKHVATKTDAWCYDALPERMDPQVKDGVRKQVSMRFIPYLGRVARSRVSQAAGL